MLPGQASQSMVRTAVRRAAHQLLDHPRIFDDPIAVGLIPEASEQAILGEGVFTSAGKHFLRVTLPRPRDLAPLLAAWIISVGVMVFEKDLGTSLLLYASFLVMVYIATDPPVKLLRRLIPPLRIGAVSIDLSVMILLLAILALYWVVVSNS